LRRTAVSAEIQFVQLFGASDDIVYAALATDGLGVLEFQDAGVSSGTPSAAGPIGAWVRYQLDVDYQQKTAKLTSGGAPVSSVDLRLVHAGPYTLWIGATALPSSADATVWLDDLDVWTE
jgi:hypothetical protein